MYVCQDVDWHEKGSIFDQNVMDILHLKNIQEEQLITNVTNC